jgi:mannose-6-phosphate isomerase-like protein (cupin superfamily)
MRSILVAVSLSFVCGCAKPARGTILHATDVADAAAQSGEAGHGSGQRNLRRSPEASFHLIRIDGPLQPRVHDKSDLVLFVVSGELDLNLGKDRFRVQQGDVVEIPRGTPYAAHSRRGTKATLYGVATPPLSPDDQKPAAKPRESVWKWDLWIQ